MKFKLKIFRVFQFNLLCRLHVYVYIKTVRGKCYKKVLFFIFSAVVHTLSSPLYLTIDVTSSRNFESKYLAMGKINIRNTNDSYSFNSYGS